MPVTAMASAMRARHEAPTGVRSTPKAVAGGCPARTTQTVFAAVAASSRPMHDSSLDAVSGVPSDGNCLYWAFGVLLGTYGTSTTQYKQLHLMPSGIRERLALRIRDPQHWSKHFLRVLELVRNILQRDPGGSNGPLPDDPKAVRGAVDRLTTYLRTELGIPVGQYTIDMSDLEPGRLTQGQAEAATDPPEGYEDLVDSTVRAGTIPAKHLQTMQFVVDTYVACSLSRDQNFAEAFEVELLAEEFGVVIYYYTGAATSPAMMRGRDFDAAQLTHVMYPSEAVRAAMTSSDAAVNRPAREEARVRGFHIVRLGQHFYYGMRRDGAAMARPWEAGSEAGSEARAALMPDLVAPEAPGSAAYAAHNLTPGTESAAKRARLLEARRRTATGAAESHAAAHAKPGAAAARTPAERKQAENTAELHHVHMAALRRRGQGVAAQANPNNPSPGYDAFAMAASGVTAVAPPSSAVPPLLPRLGRPLGTAPTPAARPPAWGSAGTRLGRGYDAAGYSGLRPGSLLGLGSLLGGGSAALDRTVRTVSDATSAASDDDDTVSVALGSLTDPRDVPMGGDASDSCGDACGTTGALYDDADIELQLAAALEMIEHREFLGPADDDDDDDGECPR